MRVHERQLRAAGPESLRLLTTLADRSFTEPLPIFAWAIEHPEGVIVIDTGESARVCEPGYFPRWNPYFRLAARFEVAPEQEIGPQLQALGIEPEDVKLVVLTHLHSDHAGGLRHFPGVEIAVARREYAAACGRLAIMRGYLPHRWPQWFAPRLLAGDEQLTAAGDIKVVATPGHTRGHLSILIEDELPVLLAGDSSYAQSTLLDEEIDGLCADPRAARATLRLLRGLLAERPTVYLPSHDPDSPRRLAAREPALPG